MWSEDLPVDRVEDLPAEEVITVTIESHRSEKLGEFRYRKGSLVAALRGDVAELLGQERHEFRMLDLSKPMYLMDGMVMTSDMRVAITIRLRGG